MLCGLPQIGLLAQKCGFLHDVYSDKVHTIPYNCYRNSNRKVIVGMDEPDRLMGVRMNLRNIRHVRKQLVQEDGIMEGRSKFWKPTTAKFPKAWLRKTLAPKMKGLSLSMD